MNKTPNIETVLSHAVDFLGRAETGPLSTEQSKRAAEVLSVADNCTEGITNGLSALGQTLSVAANTGELDSYAVFRIGWLIDHLGELLVGLNFVRGEAEYALRERAPTQKPAPKSVAASA